MKIIISPAKKMNTHEILEPTRTPVFQEKADELASLLSRKSFEEMKAIMKASDQIIRDTEDMYRKFVSTTPTYPALQCYEGIQYQYMAKDVFTEEQYEYLEDHLRILSALYGVLTPSTGIKPYRLEMQARLPEFDMYSYWKDDIYRELVRDDNLILNLASKEYSKCIDKYLEPGVRKVDVFFYQRRDGKLKEQATYAKMMRGSAVRYLAEQNAETPEVLKGLEAFGYSYSEADSSEDEMIFVKEM